jgi:Pyruvate/2-oxoacid:ferredoxin oxidoreductase delta subunit
MMDPRTLEYEYDEEALDFGEPVTPEDVAPPGPSLAERLGLALVGLGLLSGLVQVAEHELAGTWLGLLSSFGLVAAGGALAFWAQLAGTPEGIKHDGTFFRGLTSRGALGWIAGIVMTGLYVLLYFHPEYLGYVPERWEGGERVAEAQVTGGLVKMVEPLAHALGVATSQWFLYGVLYTLAILVFGVRMFMKYRHSRYQQIRTASVMLFQTLFAWYLPQLLVRFQQPYVEFNGIWPLKHDYLWPEKVQGQFLGAGSLGTVLLVFAIGGVIATPVLTYFFGKRWYCSWVCGCGGLAETLGDPWRQLSSKSTRAWKLERWLIHGVLVLVVATTVMLWIDARTTGNLYGSWSGPFRQWYGFYIGAVFSGVVGVGFYPLLGSRVWCRFGCPQAAILGIFQRVFSRFRITTNGGQCMSCGNCSTYCEMGIDVRAYAQRGENIVRASCVGCGVCSAVCPRGVLRLENGTTHADRFAGSESPVGALTDSLRAPDLHR